MVVLSFKEHLDQLGACPGARAEYGNLTQEEALKRISQANWLAWYLMMTGYEPQMSEVIGEHMQGLESLTLRQKATRLCNRISQLPDQCFILTRLKGILE